MNRTECGGCGSGQLHPVLEIGKTPLADRFPETASEDEDTYPLGAMVCTRCHLMQSSYIVPGSVLYGDDYGFHAGTSPALARDNQQLGEQLDRLHPEGPVVEIACNDGDLLRHFNRERRPVLGIDPADSPVIAARKRGLDVLHQSFNLTAAQEIRDSHGPAGLVIARNVLAHVADLGNFLHGLQVLCANDGAVFLEVQYAGDLLAACQLDHIYHEHRSFFSVSSLAPLVAAYGFGITRIDRVPAQGGSMQLTLRPDAHDTGDVEYWKSRERAQGLLDLGEYVSFGRRADYARDRINDLLAGPLAHVRLAGYGATAKSCTLLHWLDIDASLLEYVEDTTPAKIGRYTPGTKIPIKAPHFREVAKPEAFLLLAWNYLPQVLRRERVWMAGGGQLLVPIPFPVLL